MFGLASQSRNLRLVAQGSLKQSYLQILSRCFATKFSEGVEVVGDIKEGWERILSPEAVQFLADVHRNFEGKRQSVLQSRIDRQKLIDQGQELKFPAITRDNSWQVAPVPADLQCRHVEITGPVQRKMMINALNSPADVFMADFEDSNSPTWHNVIDGQVNLLDANNRTIEFKNPDGSVRTLKDRTAQLFVRTRGWHLDERHLVIDGKPISGALMDFGLYFFHNAKPRMDKGSAPYYYLPKMEHNLEAALWNDVFKFSEDYIKIPQGTIRATVMIETLPACFDMEEMLYQLRDYACGMNAGRWDYIFSLIKVLKSRSDCVLPDRKQVSMKVPFMSAYAQRLVQICHRHGAHAMGGMSAFIPSRRDEEVNKVAIEQVTQDKEIEVAAGYDGTWVAHPDLCKLAKDIFVRGLEGKDQQVDRKFEDLNVTEKELVTFDVEGGKVTEGGIRTNVSIALQYLNQWFKGNGAAALYNLMEDAATAEISRAQLWQWLHHQTKLDDGRTFTLELFKTILHEEVEKLGGKNTEAYQQAYDIVEKLVENDTFEDFLTLPGYDCLVGTIGK